MSRSDGVHFFPRPAKAADDPPGDRFRNRRSCLDSHALDWYRGCRSLRLYNREWMTVGITSSGSTTGPRSISACEGRPRRIRGAGASGALPLSIPRSLEPEGRMAPFWTGLLEGIRGESPESVAAIPRCRPCAGDPHRDDRRPRDDPGRCERGRASRGRSTPVTSPSPPLRRRPL